MIKSEKKFREYSEIFTKEDNLLIVDAIIRMRDEQPFEGGIGLLAGLFNSNSDPAVRKAVTDLMNDLKDQSVTTEIISEIKKRWEPGTKVMLVSSCWQSGLDYKDFLTDLAEIFLESDYSTALECFTVIEESALDIDKAKKDAIKKVLKNNSLTQNGTKKVLCDELLLILGK